MQNNSTIFPTKLKICGLTCPRQALKCFELGADWLGFNCWHGSSRYITPAEILEIMEFIPNSVITVGVFVNETPEKINKIADSCNLDKIQLHGDESPAFCKKIRRRVIKAFRIKDFESVKQISDYSVSSFLLDTFSENNYGGSGKIFDWNLANPAKKFGPIILAGGLTPNNVKRAIQIVKPYGVDVCSGLEKYPGIKDHKKIRTFLTNAKAGRKI